MLLPKIKNYNGNLLGLLLASVITYCLLKKMATLQESMLYYSIAGFFLLFGDKKSLERIIVGYKTSLVGAAILAACWYLLHQKQATILEVSPLILVALGALGIKTGKDIFNQNNQAQ